MLTKAVIAREIAVIADRPIDVHGVLHRLEASFGSSYRYSVDGFVGASPELLVEVDGGRAVVPAGRHGAATGDVELDAAIAEQLVASTKDQVEHRVVIDVVHDTLLPWCSYLDWEPGAVDHHRRQRPAPRHADGGAAVVAAAQRARAGAGAVADAGARRHPRTRRWR